MEYSLIAKNEEQWQLVEMAKATIIEFEKNIKTFQESEKQLKEMLLQEMENAGIKSLTSNEINISYVSGGSKETFDSKRFRQEHPEMYDEYVKISETKPSIRIVLK